MQHESGTGPSDESLVRATLGGDRSAFEQLVRRHQAQALAVSTRILNHRADAMEVVQDAFLKAYASLKTLQQPAAFAGWLMRIVGNLSLNLRRGRSLRRGGSLEDQDGNPIDTMGATGISGQSLTGDASDPFRSAAGRELGIALEEALEQLPDKQKLAILMFTVQQLPQKQVAEALNCSVEAVKWHVFQGRKKLRLLLQGHLGVDDKEP